MSFFFFSSRRRHTRLQGDWSSDVCSSDLSGKRSQEQCWRGSDLDRTGTGAARKASSGRETSRSEERRVGKECRTRWGPKQKKEEEKEQSSADWSTHTVGDREVARDEGVLR